MNAVFKFDENHHLNFLYCKKISTKMKNGSKLTHSKSFSHMNLEKMPSYLNSVKLSKIKHDLICCDNCSILFCN